MSKLGEKADRILENLDRKEKLNINELGKMPADAAVLGFMEECGLIELIKNEVRITEFGSHLLKVN